MINIRNTVTLALLAVGAACSAPTSVDNRNCSQTTAPLTGALAYRGVNLAGAEFAVDPYGNGSIPGTFGTDYIYPDPKYSVGYTSADYYRGKGMNIVRLPFRWERLQQTRGQALDAAELTRLTTTVNDLLAKGFSVLVDPHNYARYGTGVIGSSAVSDADFADFWSRVATVFKGSPNVLFGLMNEPHDMPTEQWAGAANAAIAAIRAAGATNLILVPGNGWTGADSWTQNWYGTPNGTVLLTINDPANNYAFEVHQYLDTNSSGTSTSCVSATIGSQRMAPFTAWLRANGKRGFLGEFSGGADATCLAAIGDILSHLEANSDVYLGWTYWAGGPWWGNGNSLEPTSTGADKPQMGALLPHLATAAAPPPPPPPPPSGSSSSSSSGGSSSSSGGSSSSSGGSSSSSGGSSSSSGGSSSGGSGSSGAPGSPPPPPGSGATPATPNAGTATTGSSGCL